MGVCLELQRGQNFQVEITVKKQEGRYWCVKKWRVGQGGMLGKEKYLLAGNQ